MSNENDERDFADILAEFESTGGGAGRDRDPRPGEAASGKVLSIGEEAVFVDVGAKSDAVVSRAELEDESGALTVDVGDTVEGLISGRDTASGCLVLRVRPGASPGLGAGGSEIAAAEIAQAQANGLPVEGTVSEVVKGGVRVTVSGLRGFCPISQLELGFVEDASSYVGRRLAFLVRSFTPAARGRHPDLVLSRRSLLEAEERRRREEVLERLEEGALVRGTVTSVASYGAFVDLGGVEGLLHVSEMAHERVEDPGELVQPGEEIEVKVLSIARQQGKEGKEGKDVRISLSRKALEQDPWKEAVGRFPEGKVVAGRVVRVEPYGAFIRLAPGLDGLAHVSELSHERRIAHPRDAVSLGQDVEVKILGVDPERRRISVSLAALGADAESAAVAEYGDRDQGTGGFGSMASFFKQAKKG